MTSYTYNAYGLTVTVPFPCPGLTPASSPVRADVTLREGPVPERLAAPVAEDTGWQADAERVLVIGGPRQGRFLVEGGEVLLQRNPRAADERLARAFAAQVVPQLLTQRGFLVLHANAVATERGALVLSGASGAGKSTTLAGLLDRGATMLSDDITAIRVRSAGGPEVMPGEAKIHLTPEATVGIFVAVPADIRPGPREKHRVAPASERMSATAIPLRAIYELSTQAGDDVRVLELTGVERFAALQRCVYGPLLPAGHAQMFPAWRAIAGTVPVARITRPRARWTLPEVCDALWETGGRG